MAKRYENEGLSLSPDEIVYEDDNILVIDKKRGETVHPPLPGERGGLSSEIYLIDRICAYLYQKGQYLPERENSFTPALCNRLDRNTGGLILAAKNAQSLRILNRKLKERQIKKTYLCAVHGIPAKRRQTRTDYLYKDRNRNKVFIFASKAEAKNALRIRYDDDIKTIITKYTVLSSAGNISLLEAELITGRTHQIRAHLAYLGHPLVGDGKYGISNRKNTFQALYSYRLRFDFPTSAEELDYLKGKTIVGNGAGFIKEFT